MDEPTPISHVEYDKVRMAHLYDNAGFRYRSAGDFAQLGLKSVLVAHGGALVALLAFLGNSSERPTGDSVACTFACFVAGLVSALLAVLCAYQTQSDYARQESAGADKIYFGAIGDTKNAGDSDAEETKYMNAGKAWEWAAILCFVASLAMFVAGAYFGVDALSVETVNAS